MKQRTSTVLKALRRQFAQALRDFRLLDKDRAWEHGYCSGTLHALKLVDPARADHYEAMFKRAKKRATKDEIV